MRRALICCVAIALFACGPTGPTATGTSPPVASQSPSPSPSLSPAAVQVLSIVDTNEGGTKLHVLTIDRASVTDRIVLSNQPVAVLDANQRMALITTKSSTQLATLDLQTGAIRDLGLASPGGLGPAIISPDGTDAAVAVRHADLSSYEVDIVDLASGVVRPLLQLAASAYNRAGLMPWRWTETGIVVTPGVWDGPRYKLLNLDPQSGKLTPITDAQVDVVSPDAKMLAAAAHANLGDVQFEGQGSWPNQLRAGPVGGPSVVIAQHKNRAFKAFDVANDGRVLYLADDAPFSSSGGALNDATPAPDMGIYVESAGQSVQQLGELQVAQWAGGRFVAPGLALLAKIVGQSAGTVEIDLVSLCSENGCSATTQPVERISGNYPQPSLLLLRPIGAV